MPPTFPEHFSGEENTCGYYDGPLEYGNVDAEGRWWHFNAVDEDRWVVALVGDLVTWELHREVLKGRDVEAVWRARRAIVSAASEVYVVDDWLRVDREPRWELVADKAALMGQEMPERYCCADGAMVDCDAGSPEVESRASKES